MQAAYEALRGRLAISAGGPINTNAAPWADSVHIFGTNDLRKEHNDKMLGLLGMPVYGITALDRYQENSGFISDRPMQPNDVPGDEDQCAGLSAFVSTCLIHDVSWRGGGGHTGMLAHTCPTVVEHASQ